MHKNLLFLIFLMQIIYFVSSKDVIYGQRIINGVEAIPHQFPFKVSLKYFDKITGWIGHNCGGDILTVNFIISAAHCFAYVNPGYYEVWAGKHNLTTSEIYVQMRQIEYTLFHPKYNPLVIGPNDISLSKLEYPFKITETVQTISLPIKDLIPIGNSIFSGWGSISNLTESIMPDVLQVVTLPILSYKTCANILINTLFNESDICTGPLDGSRGTCSGDSGGGLIQKNSNGKYEIVGIMSWGIYPCGQKNSPTVYGRVSHYIEWINDIIQD